MSEPLTAEGLKQSAHYWDTGQAEDGYWVRLEDALLATSEAYERGHSEAALATLAAARPSGEVDADYVHRCPSCGDKHLRLTPAEYAAAIVAALEDRT